MVQMSDRLKPISKFVSNERSFENNFQNVVLNKLVFVFLQSYHLLTMTKIRLKTGLNLVENCLLKSWTTLCMQ